MQKEENRVHGNHEELDRCGGSGVKDRPTVYDVPVDRDWAFVILFSKYMHVFASDQITFYLFIISVIDSVEPMALTEHATSNGL